MAEGLEVSSNHSFNWDDFAVIAEKYNNFRLHEVTTEVEKLINEANTYLNEESPWKKEGSEKEAILNNVILKILNISALLEPIMPETSLKIKDTFINNKIPEILFQRIV
jgi:methionyl-tRNA synthetase